MSFTSSLAGLKQLEVTRASNNGSNPACHTKQYFSPIKRYCEMELVNLGNWVSIGFSTSAFKCNGGDVVGGQASIKNIGCVYIKFLQFLKKFFYFENLQHTATMKTRVAHHFMFTEGSRLI